MKKRKPEKKICPKCLTEMIDKGEFDVCPKCGAIQLKMRFT